MKLRFLVITLLFLSFSIFSQPAGLSFYGRYLTDKELDEKPSLKVNIPFYNKFEHEVLTVEDNYGFALNNYYDYKTRHFIVEQDSNGTQWIHISIHSSSERIGDKGKFAKSQILNQVNYDFKQAHAISLDWCAKITNPPAKHASINVLCIRATSTSPSSVPLQITCQDNFLYLLVKDYDLRELSDNRYSQKERSPSKPTTTKIKLCPYNYGEILTIRLEVKDNAVATYINGEKKGYYKYESELLGNYKFMMTNKHDWHGDFFNEAFYGNLKVEEL